MVDLWMPDVRVAKIAPRLMDKTGRFTSPLSGNVRTIARPGERWGIQLDYMNLAGQDRARLESFIAAIRGAANRVLYSPGDYVQRGSFPSTEILANNTFTGGLGTWAANSQITATVQDRVYRSTRNAAGVNQAVVSNPATAVTQYAPLVARAMLQTGRGAGFSPTVAIGSSAFAQDIAVSVAVTTGGLAVIAGTPSVVLASLSVIDNAVGAMSGDYFSIPFVSLTRCPLSDSGNNMLSSSDTVGVTSWALTNATAGLTASAAPDGGTDAYSFTESTATGLHDASQAAVVASFALDYSFSVFVNNTALLRTWCWIELLENTGSTAALAYFNMSTGAFGTASVGANWANIRTAAVNYGNGWFQISVTARKTNAATSISAVVGSATANGTQSFAGTASVAFLTWRATLTQSSVPSRAVQTAGSGIANAIQTGNAIYCKGLPVSINGLLLPGDWFEISKELKRVTAPLNSDAAGLGYLQFSPPLRTGPADNDPVIINFPMGRFILSAQENGWQSQPPYFANSSLDLVEAM